MFLTDEQNAILNGEKGETLAKVMKTFAFSLFNAATLLFAKTVECEVHDGYIFVKPSATALEYLEGIQADETVTLTIWLVEEPDVKVTLTRIINVYLPN